MRSTDGDGKELAYVDSVPAGYVMYGSSTMLVFTTGQGVHGFTYEPSVGEFLLSNHDIHTPDRGHIYSVNEGNYARCGLLSDTELFDDWRKFQGDAA